LNKRRTAFFFSLSLEEVRENVEFLPLFLFSFLQLLTIGENFLLPLFSRKLSGGMKNLLFAFSPAKKVLLFSSLPLLSPA